MSKPTAPATTSGKPANPAVTPANATATDAVALAKAAAEKARADAKRLQEEAKKAVAAARKAERDAKRKGPRSYNTAEALAMVDKARKMIQADHPTINADDYILQQGAARIVANKKYRQSIAA